MILDTSQDNIEVIGDVKEFKTSIDPKNLELITTLLSSNLYSDPEQSFIREIVSNAWDSHVEAGTTDEPVIIKFSDGLEHRGSITIRDYGTGLSPERFKEVYCNIGSSTKRDSNEYIGGFGIGKYSSLACSNTVYITSYYNSTAYYYVMVKSGNSITTNLLIEKPTEEKNGVEITIKNIWKLDSYDKALQCITFFPNIYVEGAKSAYIINNTKIKRFQSFAAASTPVLPRILLGNVLYPCNQYLLSNDARQFINKLNNTGIVLAFNVGELSITPNRENIIYSSETINKIEAKAKEVKAELKSLINKKLNKDYDNIIEYYAALTNFICYEPTEDTFTRCGRGYRVNPVEMDITSITYKGENLKSILMSIGAVLTSSLPNYKGFVYNDRILTRTLPWQVREENTIKGSKKILTLNSKAKLTKVVRAYLRENYDKRAIITSISLPDFKTYIKDRSSENLSTSPYFNLIVEGIYESLMKNSKNLDLNTDTEFLQYKASLSSNKVTIRDTGDIILYTFVNRYRRKRCFIGLGAAAQYLKELQSGVILANMDVAEDVLPEVAELRGYAFIKANKTTITKLKSLHLKCVVDIDWVLHKDPVLSKMHTILKHFPKGIPPLLLTDINSNVTKELQQEFNKLARMYRKYGEDHRYRELALGDEIPCDSYTEYLCLKLKNYIDKHQEVQQIVDTVGTSSTMLTTAVILKTKAYRISGDAYMRVKKNKLLNVLCRK